MAAYGGLRRLTADWRIIYSVSQNIHPWGLLAIFSKRLGILQPNFTCLFVPIYARLRIFIQLSATLTKLCHVKCDHPACVSVDGGHFENIMVIALNMAYGNFVKVAGNWIKICSLAYIWMCNNRHVKFGLKILNRFGKMSENFRGGIFWLTLYIIIHTCWRANVSDPRNRIKHTLRHSYDPQYALAAYVRCR